MVRTYTYSSSTATLLTELSSVGEHKTWSVQVHHYSM